MPKMTHWNHPDPIDVSGEKAAVYAAQGWVAVGERPRKVQPAVVREPVDEQPSPQPQPARKAPAKKAAKKAAPKKS